LKKNFDLKVEEGLLWKWKGIKVKGRDSRQEMVEGRVYIINA
jgi:hypothetical protein